MLFPAPAVKNQETSQLFLNSEDEHPESRVVIEKGVMWEYSNTAERESIQTTGPLKYGVLLMVSPTLSSLLETWTAWFGPEHFVPVKQVHSGEDSKVTVSYKYIIQNRLRSSLESNLLTEDAIFYEWALKRWSHCSKPCGGGLDYRQSQKQYAHCITMVTKLSIVFLLRKTVHQVRLQKEGWW